MNIGNGVMNGTYFPKEHFKAIDFSYFPIIKSGNLDNLTIHSGSDDEELKAGIIIVSLGIRYYQFCSSITRTFIMFPTYNTMVAVSLNFNIGFISFVLIVTMTMLFFSEKLCIFIESSRGYYKFTTRWHGTC